MYDTIKDKTVTCKKDRSCEWCGERIYAGEKAQYRVGVIGGDLCTGYQHPECYDAMCRSDREDFDFGEFEIMEQKRGKTMGESHA